MLLLRKKGSCLYGSIQVAFYKNAFLNFRKKVEKLILNGKNLNLYQIHNYVVIQMTFCLFSALTVNGRRRRKAPTAI